MTARNRTTSSSLPRKRRRPAKSCEQCRERKVRCDLQLPCRACRHARGNLTCTYRESPRPRPSQTDARAVSRSPDIPASTFAEGDQSQQQSRGLGSISFTQLEQDDVVNTRTGASGSSLQHLEDRLCKAEQQLSELSRTRQFCAVSGDLTIPGIMPRLRNTAEKTKLFGPSHWMYTAEKIASDQIDSQNMDISIVDMKADLADMVKECRNLRKAAKSQRKLQLNDPVPDLLSTFPERHVCDELASAYIRTFEKIYRVVHIPSFWKEYYQFWEAPHASSTSFLIKLGLIFSIGTTFYPILGESERLRHLAQTWIYAAQWWLVGPSEKSTRNLDGIQVFCLLLVSRKTNTIGSSPWLSTGSLLRMAMTMGLHRDPRVFPGLAPFQAEMRSRLWTTILELVVHGSIDSSSMPLMISPQDFDNHVPHNINDADLWPATQEFSTPKPLKQFTESSIQLLMRQSLPIRMEAAKLINSSNLEQSYNAVLQIATDLQKACRDLATYFQLHWPQYSGETDLHRKFLDMQIRRYILLLHRPYMLQAQHNPRFYLSRKICGESAMIIASYAESLQLPSQNLDDLSRLMVMSTGPFCGALHLDIITVLGLEVTSQLKETATGSSEPGQLTMDPLAEMLKAQREPMIRILEHINDQMLQVVALGIARFKRYIFLSVVLCQIRALESGTRDIRPLMIKAVQESVKNCYMAVQSSQSVSTPQGPIETLICTESPPGLDFNLMDPNLDFSAFFAHFSGGGGDGMYEMTL
ncbi:C6 transcription factor [Aspergillus flavus AF70]|nr:C6 transcription factor [Aspergillus flavus AF70]